MRGRTDRHLEGSAAELRCTDVREGGSCEFGVGRPRSPGVDAVAE